MIVSTFVKLTSGFNFTKVLQAAFTRADSKRAKKLLNLTVFFVLLGSTRVKAARRTFVKLTSGFRNSRSEFDVSHYYRSVDLRYLWLRLHFTRTDQVLRRVRK